MHNKEITSAYFTFKTTTKITLGIGEGDILESCGYNSILVLTGPYNSCFYKTLRSNFNSPQK
jgi:hypothetical protein